SANASLLVWTQSAVGGLVAPRPDGRPVIEVNGTGSAVQGFAAGFARVDPSSLATGSFLRVRLGPGERLRPDLPAAFDPRSDILLVRGTDTFRLTLRSPAGHGDELLAVRFTDVTGDGRPDLLVWGRDLSGGPTHAQLVAAWDAAAQAGNAPVSVSLN